MSFESYGWWKRRLYRLKYWCVMVLWLGFSVLTVGGFVVLGARIGSWIAPSPFERWELDGWIILDQYDNVIRPRGEEPGMALGLVAGVLVWLVVAVYAPKLLRRARRQSATEAH